MEGRDTCALLPMVLLEDGTHNIPNELIRAVWRRIVEEGKDKALFWGGSVQTEDQFVAWLKSPFNHPVFVVDGEPSDVTFLAWLNNYADKVAMAHFTSVGAFNMEHAKKVMRYWAGMKDAEGNPLLRVVTGLIPTVNTKAIRMIRTAGWTVLGEIPDTVVLWDDSRSGMTIGYFETKDWR